MAKTKSLALTASYQEIKALTVCSKITISEDESVAGFPTVGLAIKKPSSSDDARPLTAGKSYVFEADHGKHFHPGDSVGWVAVQSGSTTGIQDEA